MSPIVSTIEVARPPEEVFSYVTDPTRFREWQHDVVSVQADSRGTPVVGSRFRTIRRIGGVDRTMTQEVTELDTPRRWTVRGVDGAIRPSATVTVEPIETGARVTFILDFEGHGIGVPLAPLVRRQAEKEAPASYRNLKALLEGDRR